MPYSFDVMKATCALLVGKIIDGGYPNSYCHSKVANNAHEMHKEEWLHMEREIVREFGKDKPSLTKQCQCTSNLATFRPLTTSLMESNSQPRIFTVTFGSERISDR